VSLVGDGPLRDVIASQVAVLNRGCQHVTVEMLGHRDDIASVLEDADVLVLSSLSEGMPLVLLEAMAASTPIVATDVGGVRECCDDGGAGMLVPPADPVALADALGARSVRPRSAGTACGSSEGPSPRPGGDSMAGHLRGDDRPARALTTPARATAVPPNPTVHETASGSLRW
jgi:hypothetical protein